MLIPYIRPFASKPNAGWEPTSLSGPGFNLRPRRCAVYWDRLERLEMIEAKELKEVHGRFQDDFSTASAKEDQYMKPKSC